MELQQGFISPFYIPLLKKKEGKELISESKSR